MKFYITCKSGHGKEIPTPDVTNIFKLKSVWDRVQALLWECLFQAEEFDSPWFHSFKADPKGMDKKFKKSKEKGSNTISPTQRL